MDTIEAGHNSGIAVYNEFRSQLGELREANAKTHFDYEDPKGNKEARSHVYKLRQTKSAVEKARKEEKSASLEYGRRVDEQAKRIMGEIDEMIDVHAKPLAEIDQREKDRVARLESSLNELIGAGSETVECWLEIPVQTMKDRLAEVENESIGEDLWQEFALRAAHAKDVSIKQMREAIARRDKHDAEQAELERLRQEDDARKQAEREEEIRAAAAQKAKEEAEQKAKEEAQRAEEQAARAKQESERRELELKLVAERAEREKAEAEQRAANAAKEAEDRVKRESEEKAKREAEESARREADKKHRTEVNNAAVDSFISGGMTKDAARLAVTLIAKRQVNNVTISY